MKFCVYTSLILITFTACIVNVNAESIRLYPDRDATLIEEPHGTLANGAGEALFVGRTGQASNGLRRALLHFDVAGALPDDAMIENVSLELYLTPSNSAPSTIGVHRVLDDWSEGPSSSAGGGGAGAQPGDVTWLHTNYDVAYWKRVGGHFADSASIAIEVGPSGTYTWGDTPQLLADVRLWLNVPHRNFGWLLMGDEETRQSVKRFASREASDGGYRPGLTVDYRLQSEWLNGLWLRARAAFVDQDDDVAGAGDVRDYRVILNYDLPIL